MEFQLKKISLEQFFGIVPIDEELIVNSTTIVELFDDTVRAIEAVETRKPDQLYEDIREKEEPFDGIPYAFAEQDLGFEIIEEPEEPIDDILIDE